MPQQILDAYLKKTLMLTDLKTNYQKLYNFKICWWYVSEKENY